MPRSINMNLKNNTDFLISRDLPSVEQTCGQLVHYLEEYKASSLHVSTSRPLGKEEDVFQHLWDNLERCTLSLFALICWVLN